MPEVVHIYSETSLAGEIQSAGKAVDENESRNSPQPSFTQNLNTPNAGVTGLSRGDCDNSGGYDNEICQSIGLSDHEELIEAEVVESTMDEPPTSLKTGSEYIRDLYKFVVAELNDTAMPSVRLNKEIRQETKKNYIKGSSKSKDPGVSDKVSESSKISLVEGGNLSKQADKATISTADLAKTLQAAGTEVLIASETAKKKYRKNGAPKVNRILCTCGAEEAAVAIKVSSENQPLDAVANVNSESELVSVFDSSSVCSRNMSMTSSSGSSQTVVTTVGIVNDAVTTQCSTSVNEIVDNSVCLGVEAQAAVAPCTVLNKTFDSTVYSREAINDKRAEEDVAPDKKKKKSIPGTAAGTTIPCSLKDTEASVVLSKKSLTRSMSNKEEETRRSAQKPKKPSRTSVPGNCQYLHAKKSKHIDSNSVTVADLKTARHRSMDRMHDSRYGDITVSVGAYERLLCYGDDRYSVRYGSANSNRRRDLRSRSQPRMFDTTPGNYVTFGVDVKAAEEAEYARLLNTEGLAVTQTVTDLKVSEEADILELQFPENTESGFNTVKRRPKRDKEKLKDSATDKPTNSELHNDVPCKMSTAQLEEIAFSLELKPFNGVISDRASVEPDTPASASQQSVDLLIGHTSASPATLDLCYLRDDAANVEYTLVRRHFCCGNYGGPELKDELGVANTVAERDLSSRVPALAGSKSDLNTISFSDSLDGYDNVCAASHDGDKDTKHKATFLSGKLTGTPREQQPYQDYSDARVRVLPTPEVTRIVSFIPATQESSESSGKHIKLKAKYGEDSHHYSTKSYAAPLLDYKMAKDDKLKPVYLPELKSKLEFSEGSKLREGGAGRVFLHEDVLESDLLNIGNNDPIMASLVHGATLSVDSETDDSITDRQHEQAPHRKLVFDKGGNLMYEYFVRTKQDDNSFDVAAPNDSYSEARENYDSDISARALEGGALFLKPEEGSYRSSEVDEKNLSFTESFDEAQYAELSSYYPGSAASCRTRSSDGSDHLLSYNLVIDNPVYSSLCPINFHHHGPFSSVCLASYSEEALGMEGTSDAVADEPNAALLPYSSLNHKQLESDSVQKINLKENSTPRYGTMWSQHTLDKEFANRVMRRNSSMLVKILTPSESRSKPFFPDRFMKMEDDGVSFHEQYSSRLADQLRVAMQKDNNQLVELQRKQLSTTAAQLEKSVSEDSEPSVQRQIQELESSLLVKEQQLKQLEEMQQKISIEQERVMSRYELPFGDLFSGSSGSIMKTLSEPQLSYGTVPRASLQVDPFTKLSVTLPRTASPGRAHEYVNWSAEDVQKYLTSSASCSLPSILSKISESTSSHTISTEVLQELENLRLELVRAEEAIEQRLDRMCMSTRQALMFEDLNTRGTRKFSKSLSRGKRASLECDSDFVDREGYAFARYSKTESDESRCCTDDSLYTTDRCSTCDEHEYEKSIHERYVSKEKVYENATRCSLCSNKPSTADESSSDISHDNNRRSRSHSSIQAKACQDCSRENLYYRDDIALPDPSLQHGYLAGNKSPAPPPCPLHFTGVSFAFNEAPAIPESQDHAKPMLNPELGDLISRYSNRDPVQYVNTVALADSFTASSGFGKSNGHVKFNGTFPIRHHNGTPSGALHQRLSKSFDQLPAEESRPFLEPELDKNAQQNTFGVVDELNLHVNPLCELHGIRRSAGSVKSSDRSVQDGHSVSAETLLLQHIYANTGAAFVHTGPPKPKRVSYGDVKQAFDDDFREAHVSNEDDDADPDEGVVDCDDDDDNISSGIPSPPPPPAITRQYPGNVMQELQRLTLQLQDAEQLLSRKLDQLAYPQVEYLSCSSEDLRQKLHDDVHHKHHDDAQHKRYNLHHKYHGELHRKHDNELHHKHPYDAHHKHSHELHRKYHDELGHQYGEGRKHEYESHRKHVHHKCRSSSVKQHSVSDNTSEYEHPQHRSSPDNHHHHKSHDAGDQSVSCSDAVSGSFCSSCRRPSSHHRSHKQHSEPQTKQPSRNGSSQDAKEVPDVNVSRAAVDDEDNDSSVCFAHIKKFWEKEKV